MSCLSTLGLSVPTESSPTWPTKVEEQVSTNLRLSHATGQPLQNSLARRNGVKLRVEPVFVSWSNLQVVVLRCSTLYQNMTDHFSSHCPFLFLSFSFSPVSPPLSLSLSLSVSLSHSLSVAPCLSVWLSVTSSWKLLVSCALTLCPMKLSMVTLGYRNWSFRCTCWTSFSGLTKLFYSRVSIIISDSLFLTSRTMDGSDVSRWSVFFSETDGSFFILFTTFPYHGWIMFPCRTDRFHMMDGFFHQYFLSVVDMSRTTLRLLNVF